MARITDQSGDDKAEKGSTPPLSREEFLSLHVGIWGSLEFCRDCNNIVYNGECSRCKERDKGGNRYKVSRFRQSDRLASDLVDNHLQQIGAREGKPSSTDTVTFTQFIDAGQPGVGRLIVNPALPQPVVGQFQAHIVVGDLVPPPPNEVAYRINNVGELEVDPPGVGEPQQGEGMEWHEVNLVDLAPAARDLPLVDYHEPEDGLDDYPDPPDEEEDDPGY